VVVFILRCWLQAWNWPERRRVLARLDFFVAGDEPDVRVEVLARTVRLEFQITHADHRGARAELVKEIHELLVGGNYTDVLHLFDKKTRRSYALSSASNWPANSAGFGLRLNRTHEIDGLVFGATNSPSPFHAFHLRLVIGRLEDGRLVAHQRGPGIFQPVLEWLQSESAAR